MMFNEKLSQTIKEISDEMSRLSDEEFWQKFNSYKDGDIAHILIEANAAYADNPEPIAECTVLFTISPIPELYKWISKYASTDLYSKTVSNDENNNIVIPCEEECLKAA